MLSENCFPFLECSWNWNWIWPHLSLGVELAESEPQTSQSSVALVPSPSEGVKSIWVADYHWLNRHVILKSTHFEIDKGLSIGARSLGENEELSPRHRTWLRLLE